MISMFRKYKANTNLFIAMIILSLHMGYEKLMYAAQNSKHIDEGAEGINSIAKRLTDRKARIETLCIERNLSIKSVLPRMLVSVPLEKVKMRLDTSYSWLVWCHVPKVGTTDWWTTIIEAMRDPPQLDSKWDNKQLLAMKLTGSDTRSQDEHRHLIADTKSTVSVMVMRNPMERLVSAFREKIECGQVTAFPQFNENLVLQFRQKGINHFGKEFYNRNIVGRGLLECNNKHKYPTFWEFIQW